MNRGRDACVSLRKTYNALLRLIITWNWLAGVVAGTPVLYLISFMIYNSVRPSYISSLLSTSGYSVFGVLLAAWIIGAISIWKNLPNLLTLTIFIYTCLGHWSLVSFIVVIFYGFSNLPGSLILYLCTALLPSVLLLLFSGDLMRKKRTMMFEALATSATAATAATASSASSGTSATATTATTPIETILAFDSTAVLVSPLDTNRTHSSLNSSVT